MAALTKNVPLLVITGETASGKSHLALQLAQRYNGEIICADSWTVRRRADIGTAKPTAVDRALVPHHLLDVAGPDEDFTAAVFKRLALKAIEDIAARGHLPIMVGGTGLYIDGILYDYGYLPPGDRLVRQSLNKLSNAEILKLLENMGISYEDVDTGNKRRLIRLLETGGQRPSKKPLRSNTLIIGIKLPRDDLKQAIERRTDAMLAGGLETEVAGLVNDYGWGCEALKGVGYAQWHGYFEGRKSLETVRNSIIKATLDLAKRQRTWFKRNKSIHWFSAPVNGEQVDEVVTTFLASDIHT